MTQDSQSESLCHLSFYKYSFQVDGRRIFCQSQPFPCSYERLFFVLCQYSLVLADITVVTVVSTELQWENLCHFISQTRFSKMLNMKKKYGELGYFLWQSSAFFTMKRFNLQLFIEPDTHCWKMSKRSYNFIILQSKLLLFFVEVFR